MAAAGKPEEYNNATFTFLMKTAPTLLIYITPIFQWFYGNCAGAFIKM